MNTENTLSAIQKSINNGKIYSASINELKKYNSALCHPQAYTFFSNHQFSNICRTVEVQLIITQQELLFAVQRELLQKHNTDLNMQNTKTQYYILAFTIVSLASSFFKIQFNI